MTSTSRLRRLKKRQSKKHHVGGSQELIVEKSVSSGKYFLQALTARDLERGTVGILIHLYRGDSIYKVKFLKDPGQTIG